MTKQLVASKLNEDEIRNLIKMSNELASIKPDVDKLLGQCGCVRDLRAGTDSLKCVYESGALCDWQITALMREGRLFSEPIYDDARVRDEILNIHAVLGDRTFDDVLIIHRPLYAGNPNEAPCVAYVELPDGQAYALEICLETARLVERLSIIETARPQNKIRDRAAISYGVSSFGYDVRLGTTFKTYGGMQTGGGVIDPLNFDSSTLATVEAQFDFDTGRYKPIILPPHAYCLSSTQETFVMPRDTIAICLGKSTYARSGVIVNVTPIEPGFIGQVTLEIVNVSSLPVYLYPGQGICQFLIFAGETPRCDYATRAGKYQHQTGVTPPRANRHS